MSTATATANAPAGSMKNSKRITKGLTYLALTLGSIIMIFPFVWMVLTCFKTQGRVDGDPAPDPAQPVEL